MYPTKGVRRCARLGFCALAQRGSRLGLAHVAQGCARPKKYSVAQGGATPLCIYIHSRLLRTPTYAGVGSRATAYARRPPTPRIKVAPTLYPLEQKKE